MNIDDLIQKYKPEPLPEIPPGRDEFHLILLDYFNKWQSKMPELYEVILLIERFGIDYDLNYVTFCFGDLELNYTVELAGMCGISVGLNNSNRIYKQNPTFDKNQYDFIESFLIEDMYPDFKNITKVNKIPKHMIYSVEVSSVIIRKNQISYNSTKANGKEVFEY